MRKIFFFFPSLSDTEFKLDFSITSASSTVFAFLGEFHDAKNRARVLMISMKIYYLLVSDKRSSIFNLS